jgi:type II secretory pathway component PulM
VKLSTPVTAASALLARLNDRERRLVISLLVLLAAALLWTGVMEPLSLHRQKMTGRIDRLTADLGPMLELEQKIAQLRRQGRKTPSAKLGEGVSLFSLVSEAASGSVATESVASINPGHQRGAGGQEENTVELKIQSATLPALLTLLRRLESAAPVVLLPRLELRRSYGDSQNFDMTVVAAASGRP